MLIQWTIWYHPFCVCKTSECTRSARNAFMLQWNFVATLNRPTELLIIHTLSFVARAESFGSVFPTEEIRIFFARNNYYLFGMCFHNVLRIRNTSHMPFALLIQSPKLPVSEWSNQFARGYKCLPNSIYFTIFACIQMNPIPEQRPSHDHNRLF